MGTRHRLHATRIGLRKARKRPVSRSDSEAAAHGRHTAAIVRRTSQQRGKRKGSLVDFFRHSPLGEVDLSRNADLPAEPHAWDFC